jgi:homoserine kinase
LSGAGPTILALAEPSRAAAVEAAYAEVAREHGFVGKITTLMPTSHGAHIIEGD